MEVFKVFGILGLLLISWGILIKKRKKQDLTYIIGGTFLLIYSWYLGDMIFIVLQFVFIISAIFDFRKKNV